MGPVGVEEDSLGWLGWVEVLGLPALAIALVVAVVLRDRTVRGIVWSSTALSLVTVAAPIGAVVTPARGLPAGGDEVAPTSTQRLGALRVRLVSSEPFYLNGEGSYGNNELRARTDLLGPLWTNATPICGASDGPCIDEPGVRVVKTDGALWVRSSEGDRTFEVRAGGTPTATWGAEWVVLLGLVVAALVSDRVRGPKAPKLKPGSAPAPSPSSAGWAPPTGSPGPAAAPPPVAAPPEPGSAASAPPPPGGGPPSAAVRPEHDVSASASAPPPAADRLPSAAVRPEHGSSASAPPPPAGGPPAPAAPRDDDRDEGAA